MYQFSLYFKYTAALFERSITLCCFARCSSCEILAVVLLRNQVICDVTPCLWWVIFDVPKKCSAFETSAVTDPMIKCHIPEDLIPYSCLFWELYRITMLLSVQTCNVMQAVSTGASSREFSSHARHHGKSWIALTVIAPRWYLILAM